MAGGILVVNAGSSSVKFAAFAERGEDDPALLGRGQIDGLRTRPRFVCKSAAGGVIGEQRWPQPIGHDAAIKHIIGWIGQQSTAGPLVAAGHRVVFGGADLVAPTLVDDALLAKVEALVPFFPLHLPHNLAALRAVTAMDPALPQVACFDNAFHRTYLPEARLFALPRRLTDLGVRRYGFHGLSYEYIAGQLPHLVPGASRVVVAHLGSGASLCAIRDGESIDSTLGFSGLDGLPMGTRTGTLDPGVMLYLMQALGMDAAALERLVYTESGLLGVSGISNDMRDLLASDDPRAKEAVALFVHHIGKQLGALAAVLGGLDALVFTAGIGENAAAIRAQVCRHAAWLGVRLDDEANDRGGPRISTADSAVSAWVIPTNEELMIAIHTARLLMRARRREQGSEP